MKIVAATIYALKIPFVEAFRHSLSVRDAADPIVVKLVTDSGVAGYGEGVPRVYVTGETWEGSVEHIRAALIPRILGVDLACIDPPQALTGIDGLLPAAQGEGGVIWNAARTAVELAALDCLFRSHGLSVNEALPPSRAEVTYSAVISAGPRAKVEQIVQRCKDVGFAHIKMKVVSADDIESVACVRDLLGPDVSIRLDANAAFTHDAALRFIEAVQSYDIAAIEQPLPRGSVVELAALRAASPIPLMADESLVTIDDARELIAAEAVDLFNLRLSKCGGIYNTLRLYTMAKDAGIGVQMGCHVGETAILSAAGRHLAAHLPDLLFAEGSYGPHLLTRDIARETVVFGHGGKAPLLRGEGFGITVDDERLKQYARDVVTIGKA
jgi:L-alanine-DL-glutamate epimerase-like enolase superfamily enzyme